MGKIIDESTVERTTIERCKRTVYDAPIGGEQTVMQEYELVTSVGGVVIKQEQSATYLEKVSDNFDIVIVIDGKEISGLDVAKWNYILNDNRAEIMDKRFFDPSAS